MKLPNLLVTRYRHTSDDPKIDAQRNLALRTHYVDDDTLRFHRSRVLGTAILADGLLFALIESYAVDPDNTQRAFRPVVFDLFGTVVLDNPDEGYSTKREAITALDLWRKEIDAAQLTLAAIEQNEQRHALAMAELRATLAKRTEVAS